MVNLENRSLILRALPGRTRLDQAAVASRGSRRCCCGPLLSDVTTTTRIQALPLEQLEALAEALLDFRLFTVDDDIADQPDVAAVAVPVVS
jgi:hypothetical protein